MAAPTPQAQVDSFIDRFSPEVASRARGAIASLRKRMPGAFRLVYDNYNALVIGFAPTDRTPDAFLSIALYPRWVCLFFLRGVDLHDPSKVLRGTGNQVRSVILESPATIDSPAVNALVAQAIERAPRAIPAGRGRLVIKMVAKTQRLRRPK